MDSETETLLDSQTIPLKDGSDSASEIQKSSPGMMIPRQQQQHRAKSLVLCQTNHYHRFLYIMFLLIALWMIEQSTGARVFLIIQQHEPSIRIFRSLFEVFLLLLCTAASIHVYRQCLGANHVERLLFLPPSHNTYLSHHQTTTTALVDTDESSVEILFRDHHDDDDDTVDEDHEEAADDTDDTIVEYIGDIHDGSIHNDAAETIGSKPEASSSSLIPSPAALFGSALDLLIWILVTLVLYTVAAIGAADDETLDDDQNSFWGLLSSFAAPTFPLLLFLFCSVKAFFPLQRNRSMLLKVISLTLQAPWHEVTFRDGMIGDILTSMVRPMQDIAFTICYLLFGLNQWWYLQRSSSSSSSSAAEFDGTITSNFVDVADSNVPAMEKSWLLHTLILPACAISPLWWRFLQNMRQIQDAKRRWPYLGNAGKYFVAAQVAMFGVYHPEVKENPLWLISFVFATLYQIWWDTVMDWGLFVKEKGGSSWVLRKNRLYSSKRFYWFMVVVNTVLRFCWTLSFIPLRYLSATGVLTETFSSDSWTTLLGPLIASAEIVRRSLWGLLRVEWEIVKNSNDDKDSNNHDDEKGNDEIGIKMIPMHVSSSDGVGTLFVGDMSAMDSTRLLVELSVYTSTFAILGLLIAAHRETL